MKKLSEILYKQGIIDIKGNVDIDISNICFDSRKIEKDCLFVAVRGTKTDGHDYIEQAAKQGAKAIICEEYKETTENVTFIKVENSAFTLGWICSNFYNQPSKKLKLVGITGTNGKTTTATLLYYLFRDLGYKVGLLSTVCIKINEKEIAATHTTPDALQLNNILNQMVESGCEYCFMEVSSHSVVQHRITGLTFAGGVFTNITHDHLDFHKTFDEYIKAKKGFFDNLSSEAFALVNNDDKNGTVMIQSSKANKNTFGLLNMADFKCKIIENQFNGLHLNIDNIEVWCKLVGSFNAYNLLGIYATAVLLGQDKTAVLTALSNLDAVDGRFQYVKSKDDVVAIIDYAHTPDALNNVLSTITSIRTKNETLITVVGCGGDRDAAKRPIMAEIACKWSDKVILTSDNPRSEDAEDIIKQMQKGVDVVNNRKIISITNRHDAIKTANAIAQPGDIILIAGKGHEKYQEIKGIKHHFDDVEEIDNCFKNR